MPRRPHLVDETARHRTPSSLALVLADGTTLRMEPGPELPHLAMRWAYRLRNRSRWAADAQAVDDLGREAAACLETLGLGPAGLASLGRARAVEVRIPFSDEGVGWEQRILPWELLLSTATRPHRGKRPLLVSRHLAAAGAVRSRKPRRGLAVASAPGALGERRWFENERELVERGLGLERFVSREHPTLPELEAALRELRPDVLHLTGVDAHQGAELLGLPYQPHRRDGLYLMGDDGGPAVVDARVLAAALSEGRPPLLVAFNCHHSAARLASLSVAEGAHAAIGFQDVIDDAEAERFYATFYQAFRRSGYRVLDAFQVALSDALEHSASLAGCGIVLWSRAPLLVAQKPAPDRPKRQDVRPAPTGVAGLSDALRVEVRPVETLNYALLHNDRDLFEHFKLVNLSGGTLRQVEVEVELAVGGHTSRYRTSLDVSGPVEEIARRVRLPLAWELLRTLRESARTTIYVRVGRRGVVAYSNTFPVWMLPVDEWRDTARDGLWLPSFVLPRDPAVAALVGRAQRPLRTLLDDHVAAFCGYQSLDPQLEDPSEGIDLQVRALWSTLAYDLRPGYIEPPPTYTQASQRLRCPSEVVNGGSGTCIDLALLLASCLEWMGIYPVVFLLRGHALAGYWRSPAAHHRFVLGLLRPPATSPRPAAGGRQRCAWMVEGAAFGEIQAALLGEDLVPLEATELARQGGYYRAVELGIERLRPGEGFEAMVDVTLARREGVTPLPFHAEGA